MSRSLAPLVRRSASSPRPSAPRRAVRAALLVAGGAALAACSSVESFIVAGTVDLAPGQRAEGRAIVPAEGTATIRLTNAGPGQVDYVVRQEGGSEVSKGPLTTYTTEIEEAKWARTFVIAIQAHADAEARVKGYLKVTGQETATEITWTKTE